MSNEQETPVEETPEAVDTPEVTEPPAEEMVVESVSGEEAEQHIAEFLEKVKDEEIAERVRSVQTAKKAAKKSGTPVQKRASLHEKAVQAIAKGEVPKKPRKARKKAEKRQPAVHTHIKVVPMVWDKAIAIRDDQSNTYSKVEIVNESEVLIR